jgi:hypothetical protein
MNGYLVGCLIVLSVLGVAGQATAEACSDTVSSAVCMVNDAVFGPNGVVQFGTQLAFWAVGVVMDTVFGMALGGLL